MPGKGGFRDCHASPGDQQADPRLAKCWDCFSRALDGQAVLLLCETVIGTIDQELKAKGLDRTEKYGDLTL